MKVIIDSLHMVKLALSVISYLILCLVILVCAFIELMIDLQIYIMEHVGEFVDYITELQWVSMGQSIDYLRGK